MAHAIGSATISFGLVSIPVKLHSTSQSSENISFNMLHGKCGSRLKQQYICSNDGEIVERSETVKGYEFSKGRYVVLTEEELKAIEQKASESIDIVEFVPSETIDPIYFDKSYYLSPNRGADRAYALLAEALRRTGRWAVARYAARGREHLVCVRPAGDVLVLQQLFYANQIKTTSELGITQQELRDQELKMAVQLAELGAAEKFEPAAFSDSSRNRMRELIQKKIDGEDITALPDAPAGGEVVDLMEALRASLSNAGSRRSSASRIPVKAVAERKPAKSVTRSAAPSAKKQTRSARTK